MTALFTWIGMLHPVLQAIVVVLAFLAVVGLILFLIDVAPRSGTAYTWVRLAMCVVIPVIVALAFNSLPWAAMVAAVLGGALFILDLRSRTGSGYLIQLVAFLTPAFLLLLVGLVMPTIRTLAGSFMNAAGTEFVGLQNFVWVFTQPDGIRVVANTIVWVLVVPIVSTGVGLAYAVFIDRTRGERIYKMLVFMPVAISFVGASIIWKFVYEYRGPQFEQIGLLNQILVWLGLPPQHFLLDSPWNTLFLIMVLIWVQTGFAMVVLSASVKGVPAELLEAAQLDGADAWQRFRAVTLPAIRPAIVVVLTTISIAALKVFDIVRTMTGGNFETSTLANEMYTQFTNFEAGRSAAFAVILFVLILPVLVFNARQIAKQREAR